MAEEGHLPQWRVDFLEKLLREVPLEGALVLEAGCGDGALTRLIANRGHARYVVGIDLCCSWSEGPSFATVPMSLDELQFPNGYFDVVFSQNVLEHVHDLERAWAEIKRVLKPGGVFVTEFGPLWNHAFGHHWYVHSADSFTCPVPPHGHLTMTRRDLLAIVRENTKPLSPERAAAKEYLLGGACNKRFPADYRRVFQGDPEFDIATWIEREDSQHDTPVPEEVLRSYPHVPRQDFGVCVIAVKGTKVGGAPGLSPDVKRRASMPTRPSFLQRLARKPRKLLSRL